MSAPSPAPRALELARTLVGFDTVSAHSNLGLIHCIRDVLAPLGVPVRLSWNAERTKANLFAPLFLESDLPFAIHLAFSYDEEVCCFGVRELIADLREAGIRPLACIVGEPTGMVPAIAHKGVWRYRCCVRGKASARPTTA